MAVYLPPPKRIQFVVKVSKHCNLRCRYCYEFEDLADKRRVSAENLERMYRHIAGWYRGLEPSTRRELVRHGGEPMVLPPEYNWSTLEAQRRIMGEGFPQRNVVQTNLTVLDDARMELLKDGFDGVGVSIDLFGELRVNAGGKDSLPKTLKNLDRLKAERVDFGAITVVSKANVDRIEKIIQFFHRLKVNSLRLLPLFDGAYSDQHQGYEISHEEVLDAFKRAFEQLLALDSPLRVEPIQRMIKQITHHYVQDAPLSIYDKRAWEPVLIVDTDGSVYSYGESLPGFSHGNLFESPMQDCILSPGHIAACEKAEARMRATCHKCRFFKSCDGGPMADEAGRHRSTLGAGDAIECIVEQGMLEYLERRLIELGVIDPVAHTITFPEPRASLRSIERLPLQPGVRLFFSHADGLDGPDDIAQRIQLSSGTTDEVSPPRDGLRYLGVAIVPREPWRAPTAAECELLVPAQQRPREWRIGSDMGVVRMPDEIMELFEAIFEDFGTREVLDKSRYRDHTTHPGWTQAYERLSAHLLERYALRDHGPTIVRLASAHPGMTTVTKDEVRGKDEHYYVGMHLDTWEKIPMRERNHARNRICVNMGREARQFLFINLTVEQMHTLLRRGEPDRVSDYYGTDLGHEFMRAFPGYPVVKLTVGPREAYIAPTDNLIHDATSLGKRYPDLSLHVLGYFGLAPGPTRMAGELQTRERLQV
jgi:uncharacterized protein